MKSEPEEIEVEVVEIDDLQPRTQPTQPQPNPHPGQPDPPATGHRSWHGRWKRSPGFLWPLWIILGLIAVALLLTIGVVIGIIWFITRAIARLLQGLLR